MKKYRLTDTTPSWLPLFSEISESQVSVLINAGWLEEVVEQQYSLRLPAPREFRKESK